MIRLVPLIWLLALASCGADGAPERPGPDPRPETGIGVVGEM